MSLRLSVYVFRGSPKYRVRPSDTRWTSSTSASPPPLLGRLRNDLKNAMRAKDAARLAVLRAVITEATNASKGPNPVTSDMHVLAMLRKRKAASRAAAEEAIQAKRPDIAEKQEAEIAVLDEYAGKVAVLSEEETREAVKNTINNMKASNEKINAGLVMRNLFQPGGALDGKSVEKSQVAMNVKQLLGEA